MSTSPRRPRKFFLYAILAVALSVLAALVSLELLIRARDRADPTFDKWTSLNARWVQPFVGMGEFRDATNSHGTPAESGYGPSGPMYLFRPQGTIHSLTERGTFLYPLQVEAANGHGRKKIFVMGGSAALGDGARNDDHRFGPLIERKLRSACRSEEIDVVTAAIRSFVTSQERVALELYVLPLKPDAVVFLDGFNDADQLNSATRPGDPYNQGVLYARNESALFRGLEFFGGFFRTVEYLGFHWATKEVDRRRWEIFFDPAQAEPYYDSVAAVYEDNLRHMSRRCEQEGAACFFFLQPAKTEPGNPNVPYWAGYRKITALLGKSAPLPGFFDVSHVFDASPAYFTDAVHLSDEGQDKLTDTVVQRLVESKLCSGARGVRHGEQALRRGSAP